MKELAALKLASDAITTGLEALLMAQKINELLSRVHAENRKISDDEWAQIYSDTEAALANLRAAIANKSL